MKGISSKNGLFLIALFMPGFASSMGGPCMPIAMACMEQGYTDKQSMIKQCVLPVIRGQKTLPNAQFSGDQIQQCKMAIIEKLKAKQNM